MVSHIATPLASPSQRPSDDDVRLRGRRAAFRILIGRFRDDNGGGVAIMFSLMLVALCLFLGAAVDLGRWLQARQQTIAAMDAAVLAGGRILQLDGTDVSGARSAAQRYYAENTKGRAEVIEDTISFDAVDDGTSFAATGNAYLETAFLNFARISKLPLLNTSEAQFSKAKFAEGGPGEGGGGSSNAAAEISMMLDVTGSMSGNKIKDLKAAATDLVNIVISDNVHANPVRVAIVPFAEGVRLPSSANSNARGSPKSSVSLSYKSGYKTSTATYYRTECVVERAGTNRYTDVAPGSGNYVMTLYNSNGSCGLPAADELVPLTDNKTTLKNKISGLVLSNTTAGQIGTAWAWYTLSPNWNTLWPPAGAASAYDSGTRKIAILMTDGEYNLQYDSKGVQTGSPGAGAAANADSTTQARALCTAMKTKGVTVYTVGFALGNNSTATETLNHCATAPSMAYTAANGNELKQAFRDIALKISKLYLTH